MQLKIRVAILTGDLSLVTSADFSSVGIVSVIAVVTVMRQERYFDFCPMEQLLHVLSKMMNKPEVKGMVDR